MLSTSVLADDVLQQITAYLTPDISVEIDGQKLALQNVPVNYANNIYLPVRELAGAIGLAVDWDNDTRTAKLNHMENLPANGSTENKAGNAVTTDGLIIQETSSGQYVALYDIHSKYKEKGYGFSFNDQDKSYTLIYNPLEGQPYDKDIKILTGIKAVAIDGSSFISVRDYENTLLPLLRK